MDFPVLIKTVLKLVYIICKNHDMHVRTANAASKLAQPRVVNAERLMAGNHRWCSALDVDSGRLLTVEGWYVGVVVAKTPRRARVGALWSRRFHIAACIPTHKPQ